MVGVERLRQSDITRALRAAAACGFQVSRFEIHPDGKIVVHVGEVKEPERDYLAEWRADRARRAALAPNTLPALPKPKRKRYYGATATSGTASVP